MPRILASYICVALLASATRVSSMVGFAPAHILRSPDRAPLRHRFVLAAGLPPSVEDVLPAVAMEDRQAVLLLWNAVRQCYPNEQAAVEALKKNPSICLPWACSVATIKGSYSIIVQKCGKDVALEVCFRPSNSGP